MSSGPKGGSGTVYEKVFVRHWDTWNDHTQNHLFVQSIGRDGKAAGGLLLAAVQHLKQQLGDMKRFVEAF